MKKYSQEWVDLVRASIRDTQEERDALNRARSGELSPLSNEAKRVLALEAENARLRAALVNIRRDMFAIIASGAPDQTTEDAARNTARLASEALAPESASDATKTATDGGDEE